LIKVGSRKAFDDVDDFVAAEAVVAGEPCRRSDLGGLS
jgi:hypothetical protein